MKLKSVFQFGSAFGMFLIALLSFPKGMSEFIENVDTLPQSFAKLSAGMCDVLPVCSDGTTSTAKWDVVVTLGKTRAQTDATLARLQTTFPEIGESSGELQKTVSESFDLFKIVHEMPDRAAAAALCRRVNAHPDYPFGYCRLRNRESGQEEDVAS